MSENGPESYDLASWDEFRPLILDIRRRYGTSALELADLTTFSKENQLLFRGEPDADSKSALATTLERASAKPFDVIQYVVAADSCLNELESFTGRQWDIKPFPQLAEDIKRVQDSMRLPIPDTIYPYLVYLRHHGFPSPLLDWTASPYLAAYFAFCNQSDANRAAIYVLIEGASVSEPVRGFTRVPGRKISILGPKVTTHVRHFAQQAWYTVAGEYSRERKAWSFCRHGEVIREKDGNRDVLIKITIPIAQRRRILRDLNEYNINHFTLFRSEDSLVKALGIKCFDLNAAD